MKQKIFQIICIILFFVIFWCFYGDEYWQYQERAENTKLYQQEIDESITKFSLEKIHSTWEIAALHTTPDTSFLDELVFHVEQAQEKIYVEVYIFTEKRLRDAIIEAQKRWVDVKILLENNPYQAPYLNDSHYNDFKDAGIDVRWSDPLNYSLNHAKLLIIDERTYVSTWNFSYSLFTKNRDFMVEISQWDLQRALQQLFIQDFTHEKYGVYHERLVLSPEYSRFKLSQLVSQAQSSLDIYFPYIQDDAFEELIFDAISRGVEIRFIVDKVFFDENPEKIQAYKARWIDILYLDGKKLHAKAILSDKKYLYIGSINFSTYSFDENREIGILISDDMILQDFSQIFTQDFIWNE